MLSLGKLGEEGIPGTQELSAQFLKLFVVLKYVKMVSIKNIPEIHSLDDSFLSVDAAK